MQYNRFLEIHLVSSKKKSDTVKTVKGSDRYQYDFNSVDSQQRAYHQKLQGAFNDEVDRMELLLYGGRARAQRANALNVEHVLGSQAAPIPMQNLESQHYVNCYVDLESLRPGQPLLPELEALVKWVCAKQSASGGPLAGKMRLNCHGSNSDNAGLSMGKSVLSPDDLVDALILHGLQTRDRHTGTRRDLVAKTARWKADNEVTVCEGKGCTKKFSFVCRRHHCRRCGGIFCDACTKKRRTLRNPLAEYGRVSGTVHDCRVCDDCATQSDDLDFKAGSGLVQLTLALCLAASSKTEFAVSKTGFVRNSIAARLVNCLSMKGVHGIQVSGSNEVIAWDYNTKGMVQQFEVQYPGMGKANTTTTGPAPDDFEGTEWAGVLSVETSLTIPCSILGSRGEPNAVIPSILGTATYASIRDQKIVPVMGGNKMAFGSYAVGTSQERLVKEVLNKWEFTSWRMSEVPVGSVPEISRFAGDLADTTAKESETAFFTKSGLGSSAFQTAKATAAAFSNRAPQSSPRSTTLIDAPQRRVTIRRNPRDPDSLIISGGFEERRYKDFKVYEVS